MSSQPTAQHNGPILITGASGFIGANFCRYFAAKGAEIVALEGFHGQHWRLDHALLNGKIRRVTTDLCSKPDVQKLIRDLQPSVIINCAAYGAYSIQSDADRIYEVNFNAVRTLLDCVREVKGFKAFIQAGSSSEYGRNCSGPSEDSLTVPDSHYSVSKVAASSLVQYYGKSFDVPAWSVRIYSAYGPYEEISRLIPALLKAANQGGLPPLVNPSISRDFIHVDDLSRFFEVIIEKSGTLPRGETYNAGSGKQTTIGDLVEAAREAFKIKTEAKWGSMPDRKWDHAAWYANPAKAKRDLGWEARISLREGLINTLEWMNANPAVIAEAEKHSVVPAVAKAAAKG